MMRILGLRFPRSRRSPMEHLRSVVISGILVVVSQFALAMVPRLFPSFTLVAMLPISGSIMVVTIFLGRCWRRYIGATMSPPAYVLFNILYLWGVYIFNIREVIPSLLDALLNAECALLLFGLYRILSGDPGIVSNSSSSVDSDQHDFAAVDLQDENSPALSRVRYCNSCKTSIKGFDHHCPAFGNCIGQKNHRLFMCLLAGFIIVESTYTMCSTQFMIRSMDTQKIESIRASNLVISTMLFCIIQVLWQVLFLIWHIYCICFNIKTEEWINWKRYPEFQLIVEPLPGSPISEVKFTNPYDKGLLGNIMNFLSLKD